MDKIDIVKMDIEGFEYFALVGMKDLLSNKNRRPRVLMIELFDEHLGYYGSSIRDVIEVLKSYSYSPYYLRKGKLTPMTEELYNVKSNVFFKSMMIG